MKRRSTTVLAAALVTGALLAGCGSESEDSPGKIEGAGGDGSSKSAASSPAPSAGGAGRPEIKLPEDVKNVFEGRTTGDRKKDAVLADSEASVNASDAAITSGKPDSTAVRFYFEGKARADTVDWAEDYKKAGWTITGETRYFDRKVSLTDAKTATVIYCADESKGYNKIIKTGKVKKEPADAKSFVLYNTQLVKNDKGVWQTIHVDSERGAAQCRK